MTDARFDVSVIIPTKARPDLLEVAVDSVVRQDYPKDRYEIIVVEDGSSRIVQDLVRRASNRPGAPSVRYLSSFVGGVNAARNGGIRSASADLIVLTDDDVEAPSGWLASLVRGSLRCAEAGCLGGPVRIRYEGRAPRFCPSHSLGKGELDLGGKEELLDRHHLLGANLAVRRSALEAVGSFHESMARGSGADFEWQSRYRAAGGAIAYIPDAWLWHRRTPDMVRTLPMLWTRFWRDLLGVRYLRASGQHVPIRTELWRIRRNLRHAIEDRCVDGLLKTAMAVGRILGSVLHRIGVLRPPPNAGGVNRAERSGSGEAS